MKLYQEEDNNIIFKTQVEDPFFNYLTWLTFSHIHGTHLRILDLGCGCGRNLIEAVKRGHTAVGIDINRQSLKVAKSYMKFLKLDNRVKFICKNLLKVKPGELKQFDYCIMHELIEHVEDYQKLIDISYASLKPGGILFITTPHNQNQWNLLDVYADHVRRFSINQMHRALLRFSYQEIFTIGFPFLRLTCIIYNIILKEFHKDHQAKYFRQNQIIHLLYYNIGSLLLHIDHLFNGTPYGSEIMAIAIK